MDPKILRFTLPSNMMQPEYAEELWNKALHCDLFNNEYVLKGIFIEGLHGSIWHSMPLYWSSKKSLQFVICHLMHRHLQTCSTSCGRWRTRIVPKDGAAAVETRLTKKRRKSRRQSPMSTKDAHQAPRHSRHGRSHYWSWHSVTSLQRQ